MNYYEVTFTYTTAIEPEIVNDVLAAQLGEIGFESFTENEQGMQGYIPENLYDEQALQTFGKCSNTLYGLIRRGQGLERGVGKELFQADTHRARLYHSRVVPRTGTGFPIRNHY